MLFEINDINFKKEGYIMNKEIIKPVCLIGESKDLIETKLNSTEPESLPDLDDALEYDSNFNELKEKNCFTLRGNMAKVMEGQKGGGFYAAIIQQRGTKNSLIGVVIEYPNGEESELIKFSQGEYLQAGRNNFEQVTHGKNGRMIKKLAFTKKFEDTLMEYMSPDMPIWPDVVMRTIYEKYNILPVIKIYEDTPNIEEIFKYISGFAIEKSSNESKLYMNHKKYYRFTRDDLMLLAEGLGIEFKCLIQTLDNYGFISRTPSSIGAQTKIRVNNQTHYTYNICKKPLNIQVDVQKNFDGVFPTKGFDKKYLSPSERYKLKREEEEKECAEKLGIKNFNILSLCHEFGIDIPPEFDTDKSSKSSK